MRLSILVLVAGGLLGCSRPEDGAAAPTAGAVSNVLLITLDTTRADALSCYAPSAPSTPHLDRLAQQGVRFERALTAAPMTLPAHATIMTGRYPPEHSARDNATFVVPDAEQTLAELLNAQGLHTGAVIAAPVLERSFGLQQGFEHYDDEGMLATTGNTPLFDFNTGRPAAEVTDRALKWLASLGGDARFFLWAHYFDPHQPWVAPEPYKSRYARPYDAEVAYMDEHVGRLIDGVRAASASTPLLVVVVADHGEALGAHREASHGLFLYDDTVRVPLIVSHPSLPHGLVSQALGRTADLVPTILELLGARVPPGVSGHSLVSRLQRGSGEDEDDDIAYLETMMPYTTFDLSPLFGVSSQRYKFVWAPTEELYDLVADPKEQHNLAAAQPDRVRAMRERLKAILSRARAGERIQTDAHVQQALAAIGYAGTVARAVVQEPRGGDPKDYIDVVEGYSQAFAWYLQGKYKDASDLLGTLVAKNPGSYLLNQLLGTVLGRQARHAEAMIPLKKSLEIEPNQPDTLVNLSIASFHGKDLKAAEDCLVRALKIQPLHSGATLRLGVIYQMTNRGAQARELYQRFLQKVVQPSERAAIEKQLQEMNGSPPRSPASGK